MLAGNQQDEHEVFGLQKISPTQKFMVCPKKRQPFIHFRWFHGAFDCTIYTIIWYNMYVCIYIYIHNIIFVFGILWGSNSHFDHFEPFWTILPYFTTNAVLMCCFFDVPVLRPYLAKYRVFGSWASEVSAIQGAAGEQRVVTHDTPILGAWKTKQIYGNLGGIFPNLKVHCFGLVL